MSIRENIDSARHRVIFADRESVTPTENDAHIKQLWIDVYNESINPGAVQPDGTILWDCPCLGTQAIGPCSTQFRAAFTCYQDSKQEPKGYWGVTFDSKRNVRFCSSVCSYEKFRYLKFTVHSFRL